MRRHTYNCAYTHTHTHAHTHTQTGRSLDSFVRKYTSEDNYAASELMLKDAVRLEQQRSWVHEQSAEYNKRQKLLLANGPRQQDATLNMLLSAPYDEKQVRVCVCVCVCALLVFCECCAYLHTCVYAVWCVRARVYVAELVRAYKLLAPYVIDVCPCMCHLCRCIQSQNIYIYIHAHVHTLRLCRRICL
jgi:hypothetical protein